MMPESRKRASWFAIAVLDADVGTAHVPGADRPWRFCRVRLDYDRGGWTVALCPWHIAGFFNMRRLIKGRMGRGSTAGVMWNRFWKPGQRAGWVKVEEHVSAAEVRLMDQGGPLMAQLQESLACSG